MKDKDKLIIIVLAALACPLVLPVLIDNLNQEKTE